MTVFLALVAIVVSVITLIRQNDVSERLRIMERRLRASEQRPPATRPDDSGVTPPPVPLDALIGPPVDPPPPRPAPAGPDPDPRPHPPGLPDTPPARSGTDWESLIAGQWLNHVGALALIVAIAFFLKYAFDHQWLTEPLRVLLAVAIGTALLAGGEKARRVGLPVFARGLVGAGTSVLYLAVYAAFNRYHLLPQSLAFAGMIAVTGITFWQALHHNSQTVAVLGWAGGFLTPILLSDGTPDEVGLFVYIALLVTGLLGVLFRRPDWKFLEPLTFAGTYGTYWLWYANAYEPAKLLVTLLFLTVFWGLFFGLDLARIALRPQDLGRLRHLVATNNAAFFATALYLLLEPRYEPLLGPVALLLATIYGLTFLAIHRRDPQATGIMRRYALTAMALLAIGTYFQLDGRWIVVGWGLEAVVLVWAGRQGQWSYIWKGAALLLGVAGIGLLAIESGLTDAVTLGLPAVLNQRTVMVAVLAGAVAASAWLLGAVPDRDQPVPTVLHVGWSLLLMLGIAIETGNSLHVAGYEVAGRVFWQALIQAAIWSLYGWGVAWLGLRTRLPVLVHTGQAIGLAAIFACTLGFTYEPLRQFVLGVNPRLPLVLTVLAAAVGHRLMLLRRAPVSPITELACQALLLGSALLGLGLLMAETTNHFDRQLAALPQGDARQALDDRQGLAFTVTWLVYAIGVMALGIARRLVPLRWLAIGLLGIIIVKAFVVDLASLGPLARIGSFLGLGVILLMASFLYQRFRHLITGAPGPSV